ncbi:MAG: hypothetical protein ACJAW7_001605 [Candidatus Azotimanducaceae bacterium]|jgi:hypothetical protein
MALLITLTTSRFDPSQEPENDINPIAGHSLLVWLREEILGDGCETTEPATEDWGWYIDALTDFDQYMIGSICYWEKGDSIDGPLEWMLQIHKNRTLKDKLLGRNKLDPDDPFFGRILAALNAEGSFLDVQWQSNT